MLRSVPSLRRQFRRRAAAKHSWRWAGVPRPVAQLGKHLHRMLNRDIVGGQLGKRRNGGMIRPTDDFTKLSSSHAERGKVLLIERQIEQDHREAMRVLHIDMEMLVNVSGMERTDVEYRSLFERAGLRLTNILPLRDGAGFSLFEAFLSD